MNSQARVALSGASGKVGSMLRPRLLDRGVALRSAGGHLPLAPLREGEDVVDGDLRDAAAVDRLLDGIDVLIHLAGTSVERPLDEIIQNNLVALHAVYEGARRHRVRRVVFASSNHAFGMYPVELKLERDARYRPDGLYGLSKAWGEAMARMYWDKHGIEGIALRIGSCEQEPSNPRHLSTWLGHEDALHLILCCIEAPAVGCIEVWGVSNNTRSYWRPCGDERIGYRPQQNAEDHASRICAQQNAASALAQRYQGGPFVDLDFTAPEDRPACRRGSEG